MKVDAAKEVEALILQLGHSPLTEDPDIRNLHSLLYGYVSKENDLLNQRTTWFLVIQSFAIFGISYVFKRYSPILLGAAGPPVPNSVSCAPEIVACSLIALVCCSLGWLTAQAAGRSIQAGITAQSTLSAFWNTHYPDAGRRLGLPCLMGGFSSDADRDGAYFADRLVKATRVGWIAVGGLIVIAVGFASLRLPEYCVAGS